jgi:hypothetical protein
MARPYGGKFLIALEKTKLDTLGVKLAKLCVKANIPATLVAVALEISPTTVYSWFRGQGIREHRRKAVEVFIDLLEEDFDRGVLPVMNLDAATDYISEMTGKDLR